MEPYSATEDIHLAKWRYIPRGVESSRVENKKIPCSRHDDDDDDDGDDKDDDA